AVVDHDGREHALAHIRLLPPCSPSKIVCVGRNYADHARELGNEVPAEPMIFLKPPSSLIAHGDSIVYPAISSRVDFEGEIGLIVGKRARHVRAADAWDYIAGFTCVNDVTARDLQKKDGQWTRGKGFDTFCAVGPWMVPKDEVEFATIGVRTMLDGEVKQEGYVRDFIFPVEAILEYVTQFMTLEPGDLIATGTPAGVGPMQVGSRVSVEVFGVGLLENPVVAPSKRI
ncbi:MAG: fumarylacetoacetate hydrolase family protein, partial [Acidobacteria bacterium]|nr:fumarylacetoacetate hydrolase family protein [Acidobacteriota bacterium]